MRSDTPPDQNNTEQSQVVVRYMITNQLRVANAITTRVDLLEVLLQACRTGLEEHKQLWAEKAHLCFHVNAINAVDILNWRP